jgi:hypothetical protein
MKTFNQFMAEAPKRIRISTRWHGTTKSRADKIKSDGFKGSEGSLGFGVYSTPFKGEAEYHAKRHSTDTDEPALIKLRSIQNRDKSHHINARKIYDKMPSKDPLRKDVSQRIKSRAQAHLNRGKDVVVTTLTDKGGKVTGREVIQKPETATREVVKNPQPTIRKSR